MSVVAAFYMLLAEAPAGTGQHMHLNVRPAVANAPGSVRVEIVVNPRDTNRSMRLEIDSGEYYRASEWALDGDRAARAYPRLFTQLPEGIYVVTVTLKTRDGTMAVQHGNFKVVNLPRR